MIQEIFGVNSHIKQVADGYAADGYLAIAPALFDRVQKNVELGYTPDDIAKGREIRGKVTNDMAVKDVQAAVNRRRRPARSASSATAGAASSPGSRRTRSRASPPRCPTTAAASSTTPDVAPKVPLMGHFGDKDQHIPVDGVKKLAEKYPQHQIFIYAADHGFNCDQRGSYNAPAAKQARERTLEFFRKHVG